MMADFMHENMSDDGVERLFVFRPEVEDRAAVEPHHVWKLSGHRGRLGLGAAAAAKQAQQVEFARAVHLVERFIVGKILDADHNAVTEAAEVFRQGGESRLRHEVEVGDRRRRDIAKAEFWSPQGDGFPPSARSRRRSRT